MKSQTNPQILQALQLSQALRDAYALCKGSTSLYPIERARYTFNIVLQRMFESKSI